MNRTLQIALVFFTAALFVFAGCKRQPSVSSENSAENTESPAATASDEHSAQAEPMPDLERQKAAAFALADQEGTLRRLSDYDGKIIVLEWVNPECPFVQRHYKAGTMVELAKTYAEQEVVWLAINSTSHFNPSKNKTFAEQFLVPYPVLDDSAGKVGRLYGAKTTPHLFVIDKSGLIVYKGAIDDDPQGTKTDKTNYVKAAIDDILAGKNVTTPETKPYGCSVKYAQ